MWLVAGKVQSVDRRHGASLAWCHSDEVVSYKTHRLWQWRASIDLSWHIVLLIV